MSVDNILKQVQQPVSASSSNPYGQSLNQSNGQFAFSGELPQFSLGDALRQYNSQYKVNDDSWMDEDVMTRGFAFLNDNNPDSVWNMDLFGKDRIKAPSYSSPITGTVSSTVSPASTSSAPSSDYSSIISQMASKYEVPESLINAVIATESSWNPQATSFAGAKGLMQLMPATVSALGVTNPFDPSQNIEGGVKYLAQMYKKYGNWDHALMAYNAGSENVDKYLKGQALPAETQAYLSKIESHLNSDSTQKADKYYNTYLRSFQPSIVDPYKSITDNLDLNT